MELDTDWIGWDWDWDWVSKFPSFAAFRVSCYLSLPLSSLSLSLSHSLSPLRPRARMLRSRDRANPASSSKALSRLRAPASPDPSPRISHPHSHSFIASLYRLRRCPYEDTCHTPVRGVRHNRPPPRSTALFKAPPRFANHTPSSFSHPP